jgi:hypothetical protein
MVVVAAETTVAAAAAVAAVEAPEVGVPLLTRGTRFVRSREARSDLPSGLSFLDEQSSDSLWSCRLRQNAVHNSFYQQVLDKVGHFVSGISCFDMREGPGESPGTIGC